MDRATVRRIIAGKFRAHSNDQEWRNDAIISAYKMEDGQLKKWMIEWFEEKLTRKEDLNAMAYADFTYNAKLKDIL